MRETDETGGRKMHASRTGDAQEGAAWPEVFEAVRLRLEELEGENTRLQRLVAELLAKNHQLRCGL